MRDPVSLRNIPAASVRLAQALSRQTGLSLTDVFRLALASGLLVEATKITPDQEGLLGGLEAAYLAKALRRHLGSAIDLLLEQGQHPYQGVLGEEKRGSVLAPAQYELPAPRPIQGSTAVFDCSIGDDLEALGIGLGLSQTSE